MTLPAKHPRAAGPAVWTADEIASEPVYELSREQVDAIVSVARRHDPSPKTFASVAMPGLLPSLAPLMLRVRQAVLAGRGVALLRGVPVAELTDEQCSVAFWAIGSFLGQGVSQSSAGDLVGYVHDADHKIRSYLNRSRMKFHVDLADLVGLMCVRKAMTGGQSLIANSLAIYNEMVDHHPGYLDALAPGFHWSRNNEEAPGEAPTSEVIPVFTSVDGEISCRFSGSMIRRGTAARDEVLSPVQEQALAFIEQAAERLAYATYLEPGDIHFLNNYTVLHSRTEFQNWPERGRERLLLRLWLRHEGVRDFGNDEQRMRDEPLIYNRQGRTPAELLRMTA